MELLTLSLENFQGLKHEEIQLDGHSASIYGRNASGKTTIFNAITWLLFGKPSTWAKNWDPKTKGPNGDLHNLEHSATGTFRLDDGQTVTLKKVFREVWKRKRGSAAEEYSCNTIDYQINGVPFKEKEYMAAVQEYCSGEETMKLLTMPDYFPSVMDWQKRREILLDICGDVSDADVIASTPELAGLPEFLKMPGSTTRLYKVDEYRKIAAAKKTDLNKKIEAIPNRIDEASRAIDKDLPTPEDLAAKLAAAEAEETKIAEEKRAILAGDTSELRSSLANAKADYAAAKSEYIEEGSEARAELLGRAPAPQGTGEGRKRPAGSQDGGCQRHRGGPAQESRLGTHEGPPGGYSGRVQGSSGRNLGRAPRDLPDLRPGFAGRKGGGAPRRLPPAPVRQAGSHQHQGQEGSQQGSHCPA